MKLIKFWAPRYQAPENLVLSRLTSCANCLSGQSRVYYQGECVVDPRVIMQCLLDTHVSLPRDDENEQREFISPFGTQQG
jgi:hypothetical protein